MLRNRVLVRLCTGLSGLSHRKVVDMDADATLSEIGARLREFRKNAGLSLRELAAKADMSASFLSLVERGESSLSLTSLFGIARALEIDPAEVVVGSAPMQPSAEYGLWRNSDRGDRKTVVGEREYFPFTAEVPDARADPIFVRVHPTTVATPTLGHDGEEAAVVISGTLTFQIRDDIVDVSAGDAIHFSSRIPHTIMNRTDRIAEAIWFSIGSTVVPYRASS
jgi:transcriptional regulator with XRE-family HTH domain